MITRYRDMVKPGFPCQPCLIFRCFHLGCHKKMKPTQVLFLILYRLKRNLVSQMYPNFGKGRNFLHSAIHYMSLSLTESREKHIVLSITKTSHTHLAPSLSAARWLPFLFSIAITLATAPQNSMIEYHSPYQDLVAHARL